MCFEVGHGIIQFEAVCYCSYFFFQFVVFVCFIIIITIIIFLCWVDNFFICFSFIWFGISVNVWFKKYLRRISHKLDNPDYYAAAITAQWQHNRHKLTKKPKPKRHAPLQTKNRRKKYVKTPFFLAPQKTSNGKNCPTNNLKNPPFDPWSPRRDCDRPYRPHNGLARF